MRLQRIRTLHMYIELAVSSTFLLTLEEDGGNIGRM